MINVARLTLPIIQSLHTYLVSGNFANMFIRHVYFCIKISKHLSTQLFLHRHQMHCVNRSHCHSTIVFAYFATNLTDRHRKKYMEKSVSVFWRKFNMQKKCHKHVPNRFLINHKIDHVPFTLYDFVRKISRIFRSSHARKLFHTSLCRKKIVGSTIMIFKRSNRTAK